MVVKKVEALAAMPSGPHPQLMSALTRLRNHLSLMAPVCLAPCWRQVVRGLRRVRSPRRPENRVPDPLQACAIASDGSLSTRVERIQQPLYTTALALAGVPRTVPSDHLVADIGCGPVARLPPELPVLGLDLCLPADFNQQQRPTKTLLAGNCYYQVRCDLTKQQWPVRRGMADSAVSVSAMQCLLSGGQPMAFVLLSNATGIVRPGGLTVMQFYPTGVEQVAMVMNAAALTDRPHMLVNCRPVLNRGVKLFLVLVA
ncbi:hypothetical protein BOX15_Mlig030275g1 [Macrostomum lignano]|uniref:Uncharacterized protein n=1 Tax=Macrostomum lignano TaxID=282301 RepID=A0A267GUV1_9PLAT|nr:hypothetical protein BOX15_Mlig030275g1 [Macrostomum lignano]